MRALDSTGSSISCVPSGRGRGGAGRVREPRDYARLGQHRILRLLRPVGAGEGRDKEGKGTA
eukprot:336721-Prorocentrum_minimum.AAC.1